MTGERRGTPPRTNDLAAPRDQRIVHRLSQMTLETDLPPDLQHITAPRLEAIRGTGLEQYWTFMTNPGEPPPMPVPRSIMEPGDAGWTQLVTEQRLEDRGTILLNLYELSPQDRIQVRDSLKYTIRKEGRRTDTTWLQMKAYAGRVILQLGDILAAGGYLLRAEIHMIDPPAAFHACRFRMEEAGSPQEAREQYRDQPPRVKLGHHRRQEGIIATTMTQEARRAIEEIGTKREAVRIYQEDHSFWRIAANAEHLWSEAQALRDADEVMAEHMEA